MLRDLDFDKIVRSIDEDIAKSNGYRNTEPRIEEDDRERTMRVDYASNRQNLVEERNKQEQMEKTQMNKSYAN